MKILAGPDNWSFLTAYLAKGLAHHDTRVFVEGPKPEIDDPRRLYFQHPHARFQDVLAQLPRGWEPDLVIWWLPEFQAVLPGIEDCPYPTLVLISDWHVMSDPLRSLAPLFDLVATDRWGLSRLQGVQGPAIFEGPLYGFDPEQHRRLPEQPLTWDVSHVGDLHPYLQDRRVRDLTRVSQALGSQYKVGIFEGVFGDEYTRLLNQSRITIHRSLRGEMSMRCYEAPACGSLLFCEDSNESTRQVLEDRRHCVYYNDDNLIELLGYYLEHEEERARLAQAGYEKIQDYSYARQADRLLKQAQELLASRPRTPRPKTDLLNYWGHVHNPRHMPLLAFAQSHLAVQRHPNDPAVWNIRGCVQARAAQLLVDDDARKAFQEDAIASLTRAQSLGVLPGLSLARTLLRAGRKEQAVELLQSARRAKFEECLFYPRELEFLAVQWERDSSMREATARWQVLELLSQLLPSDCQELCLEALKYRSDAAMTWFRLALTYPEGSPERRQALAKTGEFAPTFGPLERLQVDTRTCSQTLESFLQGVSFDWLQPMDPIPPHLRDREGGQLEYTNTRFAEGDQEIKERLLQLEMVPRMSTLAVAAALHKMVADMPPDECFVNVGVWHGFSFLSAILDNPTRHCVGVDNFSQFGGPKNEFLARFERWRSPEDRHHFFEMDYRDYFAQHHSRPLGVYLYDGEHSYDNQLQGLRVAEPFFAPGCIVLVDDTNWDEPRQASLDFVEGSSRSYQLIFDARTAGNHHPTWWNGLMVWRCLG